MRPESGLLSNEKTRKATKVLLLQVDESTVCAVQGKFYEVDYAFIAQVFFIFLHIWLFHPTISVTQNFRLSRNCRLLWLLSHFLQYIPQKCIYGIKF